MHFTDNGLELILGGARSGKSHLAEQRAQSGGHKLFYIATATADDDEMVKRIRHHQWRRNSQWQLVETPLKLADTLLDIHADNHCLLVDCLTLWLSNCLHHNCWQQQRDTLLKATSQLKGRVILVSNEVGSGIVPLGELSRQFADESGFLHQQLAQICRRVTLTVAGLPLELKTPEARP